MEAYFGDMLMLIFLPGFNILLLGFYTGTFYFLWSHALSLTLPQLGLRDEKSPSGSMAPQSWIFFSYQTWATLRQLYRICTVSYFAAQASFFMNRFRWMKIVLDLEERAERAGGGNNDISIEVKKTKVKKSLFCFR